jgi:hypothetical protein
MIAWPQSGKLKTPDDHDGGTMARGDKGFEKAKARGKAGDAEMERFMKKGEEAGRPGKPKLTRKDIARAKHIDRNS